MRANHQSTRPTGNEATMAHITPRRRLALAVTAIAALALGSGVAIVRQVMLSHDRSQTIADQAALAGLDKLVGADGRIDSSRMDAAATAASQAVQNQGFMLAGMSQSADRQSFSVA